MAPRPRTRKSTAKLVRLPCACANLRRTARLITQLYEDALRLTGLTGPQFTLLQTLKLAPGISQNQMGAILGMDSTTLTRSLALLRKQGWVSSEAGEDRRELRLNLTKAGKREFEKALPYWESAQKRLKQAIGERGLDEMVDVLVHAAEAIGSI
jgi:DNA-binding MarR family transcriptional regulator